MSWSASPEAPERVYGPGWSEFATAPPVVHKGGWFALLEKIVAHSGEGTLSATVTSARDIQARFSGSGGYSAVFSPHLDLTVAFSGSGQQVGQAWRTVPITAFFTADGLLRQSVPFDDGLHATVGAQYPAYFTGGGGLTTMIVGGVVYGDGLTAIVVPNNWFSGEGTLFATVVPVTILPTVTPVYPSTTIYPSTSIYPFSGIVPVSANFTGNGTLSPTTMAVVSSAASLSGSGSLGATTIPTVSTAAAFTGSGALSATATALYPATPALTGTGSLSATATPAAPTTLYPSTSLYPSTTLYPHA